ncbi:multicopper oxidase domain-containing protein [Parageobacillus thermoglucosidasius]|uniref:Copper-containing nitrite reductase n=1 Tax=Parageobacillus thermoglucosidasius TaxID=1426 RepID=A0AAN1D6E0_PARTM|nr:multicopper oxidase domain-containing protein [Parageobacillus thermoglucosidasius]KYD15521.1 Copper-containing nitrite reductase [Anoxybacillus flavithermus]ALF09799.1 nitrite reductase [Parageobacillus thermoglucosidasius]ANZ29880.1 nitrite reductase [Parageobacillus thermoglucosidasius]APM80618.1 nitrite reductase [Parageobacillus thermoglucosidasius]EID43578.1 nitrite reductase (NO-forming), copper-type [Parageobacillus thermoglucosidasius TNO-09.020]
MKRKFYTFMSIVVAALFLTACEHTGGKEAEKERTKVGTHHADSGVIAAHKGLQQKPIPLKMERIGPHDVHIEMTAQVTDIEIDKGKMYKAWTFNGQVPGPLIVVNEGDTLHFTLKNMDPAMPHSMDFHAVHASPSKDFADIMPNQSGTFTYQANNPGVFMYHCGTKPVLAHIANGMHGMMIVKPKNGYPTDKEVDREFVLIQNEWYKYNDMDDFQNGVPSYVVFSTKALKAGDRNTNGDTFTLKEKPLVAKVGDKVRIYLENVGPNEVSSFHVVGTVFDDVYIDGNPNNHLKGLQTVMLPASGGAVVEFTVTRPGNYSIVTHQFNHAQKGAVAILKVTETGEDDGAEASGH